MATTIIKEELHRHIENGDDRLLQMIYAVVKEYNAASLSKSNIKELEKRTVARKNGSSKTYNWATAKKMITGK